MAKKQFTDKYNIVKVEPGIHNVAGFGEVDLNKLTLSEADALHKAGFPFLEKKSEAIAPRSGT